MYFLCASIFYPPQWKQKTSWFGSVVSEIFYRQIKAVEIYPPPDCASTTPSETVTWRPCDQRVTRCLFEMKREGWGVWQQVMFCSALPLRLLINGQKFITATSQPCCQNIHRYYSHSQTDWYTCPNTYIKKKTYQTSPLIQSLIRL